MAQFLRPDSDVTLTWSTSTGTVHYALIDESTASDTDYIYTPDQVNIDDVLGLSSPAGTPSSGTCTVRFRESQADGGVPASSGGNASSIECSIYEGATLIATSGTIATTQGGWTTRTFTFSTTLVTNWNNLEIHLLSTGSGGAPASRRGVAISWVEVEIPDAPVGGARRIFIIS